MNEVHEFRIFEEYYRLLPKNNAENKGSVYVLHVSQNDPLFFKIGMIARKFQAKGRALYSSWTVRRTYSCKELSDAKLFRIKIKPVFEPIGEDCETIYDESAACEICGSHPRQVTPLKLKKGSIPKKDIARTYVNEVVVSNNLIETFNHKGLKGIQFMPVYYAKGVSNYQQPIAEKKLDVARQTLTGIDPFDLSERSEGGEYVNSAGRRVKFGPIIYKCPKGDNIGANLLSEVYVKSDPIISEFDYFETEQTIGSKQGVYYPSPILLCSPAFRNMVIEEKLKGFDFEVAHIVEE
jgi:hypothetical protein